VAQYWLQILAHFALQFNTDAARELYENDEYSWLVDQLNAALNEKERFMQRSASN
jgi:uncharacterized membrane protein